MNYVDLILNKNRNNNLNFVNLFETNSRFGSFMKTFKPYVRDFTKELNLMIHDKTFQQKNEKFYRNCKNLITELRFLFESSISK